jgi:ribosomal protein L12E/L44/L45/RPP1/RPP2
LWQPLLLQVLPFNQRLQRREQQLRQRRLQQLLEAVLLQVEDLRVAVQVDLLLHVTMQAVLLDVKAAPNLRRQLRNKIK